MRCKTLVETMSREREPTRCENANDLIFFRGIPEMVLPLTVNSFRIFVDHIPVCLLNPSYGKQLLENSVFGIFPLLFLHDHHDDQDHHDNQKITFFGGILDVGLLSIGYKSIESQIVNSYRLFVGHIPLCLLKPELWQAVWRIPTLEFSPLSFS